MHPMSEDDAGDGADAKKERKQEEFERIRVAHRFIAIRFDAGVEPAEPVEPCRTLSNPS